MHLLLITPPETTPHELSLVHHCLERGLHKLHVRKPSFGIAEYRSYINAIPAVFHPRLVIHGAFALVKEFPLAGIHLRSTDRQDKECMQQATALQPISRSTSFHAWDEISSDDTPWNYVFISPVFDSISKKDYKAGIDLSGCGQLKQWAILHKKPLPGIIGLGGVNAANVSLLQQNGFDGAALLGAIWESAHPAAAFDAIQQANDNLAGS